MITDKVSNQYLKPSGFMLSIAKFPDVTFQVQSATIPDTTLGVATQQTPEQDVQHPGDQLDYTPLSMSLMVDETLIGYSKLHGWMRDLSSFTVPQDDLAVIMQRFAITHSTNSSEDVTDVTLTVLDSHNNPVATFRFIDAFPTLVGGFVFDTTDTGESFLRFDVQFAFTYFRIDAITPQ